MHVYILLEAILKHQEWLIYSVFSYKFGRPLSFPTAATPAVYPSKTLTCAGFTRAIIASATAAFTAIGGGTRTRSPSPQQPARSPQLKTRLSDDECDGEFDDDDDDDDKNDDDNDDVNDAGYNTNNDNRHHPYHDHDDNNHYSSATTAAPSSSSNHSQYTRSSFGNSDCGSRFSSSFEGEESPRDP